jgi:hypothetical protein
MIKQIISGLECANADGDGDEKAESFLIDITESLAQRIKQLNQEVIRLGVLCIDDCNYEGTWSDYSIGASNIKAGGSLDGVISSIKENKCMVDDPALRVMRDSFYFHATPEGCGDDMLLSTSLVGMEFLDNNEAFISI